MNTLTEYRKPHPRYRAPDAGWRPRGGWYRHEDGSWRIVYARRRGREARRAVVRLDRGLWVWEVEEFSLASRRVRRICARSATGWLFARQAMPYAALAAREAD
jgi:hypothetical protein